MDLELRVVDATLLMKLGGEEVAACGTEADVDGDVSDGELFALIARIPPILPPIVVAATTNMMRTSIQKLRLRRPKMVDVVSKF